MKVLFDQNVPRALRKITPQHITHTADEMGWGELVNGDLLRAAEDGGFALIIKNEPQRYALTVSSAKTTTARQHLFTALCHKRCRDWM